MVALAGMKRNPSGEMDPERWSEVCEVLAPALALPPADRPQFLERACGHDSELRAEVESLIEAGGLPALAG